MWNGITTGDLNGDGVGDLAVGAVGDDDGGVTAGAVWILLLDSDGTLKEPRKISLTQGGFTGVLENGRTISEARRSKFG